MWDRTITSDSRKQSKLDFLTRQISAEIFSCARLVVDQRKTSDFLRQDRRPEENDGCGLFCFEFISFLSLHRINHIYDIYDMTDN